MNKTCWAVNCLKDIEEWPYCKEHFNKSNKEYVQLQVPAIKGFDNTPTKGPFSPPKVDDKELNQVVREGRAHGKNINKLRSYMEKGKWKHKYLD